MKQIRFGYVIASVICLVISIFLLSQKLPVSELSRQNFQGSSTQLMLEKQSFWGPCPSEGACFAHVRVYFDGRVVMESKRSSEKNIGRSGAQSLAKKINDMSLMTKNCNASGYVTDYGATYKIFLNGNTRTIEFPGCESELRQLDALLPTQD